MSVTTPAGAPTPTTRREWDQYFIDLAAAAGYEDAEQRGVFAMTVAALAWTQCVPAKAIVPTILDMSVEAAALLPCIDGCPADDDPMVTGADHRPACPAAYRPVVADALCRVATEVHRRNCKGCKDPRCRVNDAGGVQ